MVYCIWCHEKCSDYCDSNTGIRFWLHKSPPGNSEGLSSLTNKPLGFVPIKLRILKPEVIGDVLNSNSIIFVCKCSRCHLVARALSKAGTEATLVASFSFKELLEFVQQTGWKNDAYSDDSNLLRIRFKIGDCPTEVKKVQGIWSEGKEL